MSERLAGFIAALFGYLLLMFIALKVAGALTKHSRRMVDGMSKAGREAEHNRNLDSRLARRPARRGVRL